MKKVICLTVLIGYGLIGYWACSSTQEIPRKKPTAYHEIIIELRSNADTPSKVTIEVKVADAQVGVSNYEELKDFIQGLEKEFRNEKVSVPYIVDANPWVPMENISAVLEMLKSMGIKNIQFNGKLQ
jgi:biopolymer transport protein ExbD